MHHPRIIQRFLNLLNGYVATHLRNRIGISRKFRNIDAAFLTRVRKAGEQIILNRYILN